MTRPDELTQPPFASPVLTGATVRLEPLTLELAPDLVEAANRDRSSFGFTGVPKDVTGMEAYINDLVDAAAKRSAVPFAQRRTADDVLVGCTRFLNVTWWAGHDLPVEVEIGGTWLSADAQRTTINTEAKLLLLSHAFDTWGVHRVSICTDARNVRSRQAIERLGATFEGTLRRHRGSLGDGVEPGAPRDSAMYSIIAEEWPDVAAGLRTRLAADRTEHGA